MRIYSDILDVRPDLNAAATAAGKLAGSHVGYARLDVMTRPRIRSRGWNVLLYRDGSRMHFNTGSHGAGPEGAASFTDWGRFLAVLFERDPKMYAAYYDGRGQFHQVTGNRFADISGWGERGTVRTGEDGTPVTDIVTCGHCGRGWNDALGTSMTPAPSARCPYEYEHEEDL